MVAGGREGASEGGSGDGFEPGEGGEVSAGGSGDRFDPEEDGGRAGAGDDAWADAVVVVSARFSAGVEDVVWAEADE